jgi:hypothetical protein
LFKPEIYEVRMSVGRMSGIGARHYGVTNPVAQVNTGISKSNAGKRRSQTTDNEVRHFSREEMKNIADSICLLASRSSGFLATRGRYFTQACKAHLEKISDMGLLPW